MSIEVLKARGPELWAILHRWAVVGAPTGTKWLGEFASRLPCGDCKTHWRQYVEDHPFTPSDAFGWTVAAHNAINVRLGKAVLTIADARAIWRPPKSRSTAGPQSIVLRNHQSPGDILMLTAAVRDLKRATGDQFRIAVDTSAGELWANNPHIVPAFKLHMDYRTIDCHYPLIHQSHRPYHFLHGFAQDLEAKLGVRIPVTEFKGDIHLSAAEKAAASAAETVGGHSGRYWIMMAGGKTDYTAKWWAPQYYQKVVDHFAGRITFVQCGEKGKSHWHTPLKGVVDLVGKTSIRDFVRLMYRADGVVCPVTFAMHAAAAVPSYDPAVKLRPCVVIAGGREPAHFTQYPGHAYLDNVGRLSCNRAGPCWKSRAQLIGDGDPKDTKNVCEQPVQIGENLRIPKCMDLVTPAMVIAAIESYLAA